MQTHIFLYVLAYHLLVAIEKRFLDRVVHTPGGPCGNNSEPIRRGNP